MTKGKGKFKIYKKHCDHCKTWFDSETKHRHVCDVCKQDYRNKLKQAIKAYKDEKKS